MESVFFACRCHDNHESFTASSPPCIFQPTPLSLCVLSRMSGKCDYLDPEGRTDVIVQENVCFLILTPPPDVSLRPISYVQGVAQREGRPVRTPLRLLTDSSQ